jgi:hypothetical protein
MPLTRPPQITSKVSRTPDICVAIFGWLQLASGHAVNPHGPISDQEACTSNVWAINNVCGVGHLLWMKHQNCLQISEYLAPTTNTIQQTYQPISLHTSSSGDWSFGSVAIRAEHMPSSEKDISCRRPSKSLEFNALRIHAHRMNLTMMQVISLDRGSSHANTRFQGCSV